jgi:saccharopepsin
VAPNSSTGLDGVAGLVGLGVATGSAIFHDYPHNNTAPLMESIFRLNETSRNYITIACGRAGISGTNLIPPELTIMEVIPGWEAILKRPQVPIQTVTLGQHINVKIDQNGIRGANGKTIPFVSNLTILTTGSNVGGEPVTALDTGASLSLVPSSIASKIYEGVEGAQFNSTSGYWMLPCDVELDNVAISIGGIWYPIHPLDINVPVEDGTCIGGVSRSNPMQ